jgi:ABC-type lipoprotein release transport system permease subunit
MASVDDRASLPACTSVVLAEILSALIGLLAGVLPAYRAVNLHPIEALMAE